MGDVDEGVVLLDVPSGRLGDFDRDILERLGHPVIVCSGPADGTLCPLLSGEGCFKFDQAHGIVFKLDLDRCQHRSIVRRYRRQAQPDVPIRVLATAEDVERYPELLGEVEVWTHEPNVADLDGFACEVEAADRLA